MTTAERRYHQDCRVSTTITTTTTFSETHGACCFSSPVNFLKVAPLELCVKLMDAAVANGAKLVIGSVEGIETTSGADGGTSAVTGVLVVSGGDDNEAPTFTTTTSTTTLPCDAVVVAMGPWSSRAQDWLGLEVPITGIKSTSVVFRAAAGAAVEPFALFCGEDDEHGTHLEVWRACGEGEQCQLACFPLFRVIFLLFLLGAQVYPRSSGEVYLCGIGGSEYVTPERLRTGEFPPGQVGIERKGCTHKFSRLFSKLYSGRGSLAGGGGRCTPTQRARRRRRRPLGPCRVGSGALSLRRRRLACGPVAQTPCRSWARSPTSGALTSRRATTAGWASLDGHPTTFSPVHMRARACLPHTCPYQRKPITVVGGRERTIY